MVNKWRFEAQPGFFKDYAAEQASGAAQKATTEPGLGLLHRQYPSDDAATAASSGSDERDWPRFAAYVRWLNQNSPPTTQYKVLYLTRHGIGFHNLKHVELGDEAWESYWSYQDGDDKTTWFDSFLAPVGVEQAQHLGNLWTALVTIDGMPLPETLYTSPLARCLQTTWHALGPVVRATAGDEAFHPIIKERLREQFTGHTCDRRRPRSWIAANWADYRIEEGFAEEDELAKLGRPETDEEHVARKQLALEDLFDNDDNQFVSWTCHSYAIRAILRASNTDVFKVAEGTSLALLIKGEKLS